MKLAEHRATRRPELVVVSSTAWVALYFLLAIGNGSAQITLPGPGVINTVAGDATAGYSGDNGSALQAELKYPSGVAVDSKWNIYIADTFNNRIRMIKASTGVISTVAGNGTACSAPTLACGDGGNAINAELNYPTGVAVDGAGNIYIADTSDNRIRMVTASGIINTIAGDGNYGYNEDQIAALNAYLASPSNVAIDSSGNIYIVDTGNNRIRKVTSGTISTVAGNGTPCSSPTALCGDNAAATSAELNFPNGIAVDSSGDIYIADTSDERIREVTASNKNIITVAGNGTLCSSPTTACGDGSSAKSAELGYPWGISIDGSGNLYIADSNDNRIREVSTSGIIYTIAGNGSQNFGGDTGSAIAAELNGPEDVAVDSSGNAYIADSGNSRIRAVGAGSSSSSSPPASPTFSPSSGKYVNTQTVTISDTTSGVSIYFTSDGSTPTTSSTQYTAPISVISTETLNAIAVTGALSSAVATATYIVGNSPTFSPVPSTYASPQTVSISSTDFGATIYYTTNGTTPTTSSTKYTGPIGVSATETVKAIAVLGATSSSVTTATYTINAASTNSSTATITVNGSEHTGDANIITVSFDGFKEAVNYGPFSTPTSIASAFGAKFSNDYIPGGLYARATGNVITFVWLGTAPFGPLDVEGSTTSFQLTSSGFASQGTTVVDVGTVTLTVGGVVTAQTNYGDGATPSSIAEGLAANVTSGSLVNVTAADDTLDLEAKQAGAGTNYNYTLQTTSWDSTDFSQPSFAYPPLSGILSGGANASSGGSQTLQTIYSYSIASYVAGQQPTGYDADGNVVGYTDLVMGTWSMANGYDPLNRLTSASASAGKYAGLQVNWGYDAFGNRTSETYSGTSSLPVPTNSTTYYNANNQISSTSLGTVQYDSSGDVTQDNQNQYLYDGDGKLCAVKSLMFGTMNGYIYGADGTRVSTGTITTWGSCDPTVNGYVATKDSIAGPSGGQLTEVGVDANGNPAWAHTNVWVGSGLLATYDTNGIHFYLHDWTGSRRVQTDYEGVVEQTCTNLPYGDGETCSATPTEELYAGLERDSESGLDHAMFRQYSSTFGRWTTPDPYGGSYNWYDPQSLNRYSYVNCNPFRSGDPSGLDGGCTFDPSVGAYVGCGFTLLVQAVGHYGDLSSLVFSDPVWLSDLAGGAGVLAGGGELFYDFGKDFGWWGSSPFHGNVAASQNGKSVPSTGPANAPGPPAANSDPWDGHYALQAMFQSPEAGEFQGAYTTVEWASAYDAIALAPMALDAAALSGTTAGVTDYSTYVIGNMEGTSAWADVPFTNVLDVPQAYYQEFASEIQADWEAQAIAGNQPITLATEPNAFSVYNEAGEYRAFGQELVNFSNAGYTQSGSFLLPPNY